MDMIYFKRFGKLYSRERVTHVTPSGIIRTKSHNMKDEGSYLRVTGQGSWQTVSGYRETEALQKEWKELALRTWIASNWQDLSLDEIEALMLAREQK